MHRHLWLYCLLHLLWRTPLVLLGWRKLWHLLLHEGLRSLRHWSFRRSLEWSSSISGMRLRSIWACSKAWILRCVSQSINFHLDDLGSSKVFFLNSDLLSFLKLCKMCSYTPQSFNSFLKSLSLIEVLSSDGHLLCFLQCIDSLKSCFI